MTSARPLTSLALDARGRPTAPLPDAPAPPRAARDVLAVALFTVAVAANAALLFAVQPMASKLDLPLLGGTPSVWNTCMMVFQALLLGGYLYAHFLTSRLRAGAQAAVHLALFALALLALPLAAPRTAPPPGGSPSLWLAGVLLVSVGPPFFVLSAGAPLLQRWFAASGHPSAHNPYFLYAASNAGSMVALLGYPLLVEPRLGLAEQGWWWGAAYAALGLLLASCAAAALVGARRTARLAGPQLHDASPARAHARARDVAPVTAPSAAAPTARDRVVWTLLSFTPSTLLLGVTRYVTTDVAPVPLLWVVPLALYLLTFVLAFAERARVPDDLLDGLAAVALPVLAVLVALGANKPLGAVAAGHLLAFFVAALACHQALAARRPGVAHLTEFYLWLSVGGLLGGVFNALLAPALFDTLAEYPIAVALAAAMGALAAPRAPAAPSAAGRAPSLFRRLAEEDEREEPLNPAARAVIYVLGPLSAGAFVYMGAVRLSIVPRAMEVTAATVLGALAALLVFRLRPWRAAFALGVVALLAGGALGQVRRSADVLVRARSFFGAYTVKASSTFHYLQHGTTLHGAQDTRPAERLDPLTYYHRRGPLGVLFDSAARLRPGTPPRAVAVVGLGTGTMACWGRAGERWTFYEIDPVIERIARDPRYFTYLRDCPPESRVEIGDARVRLADAPAGAYDLVLLDAFSSDAIPMHLITREALAIYLAKLAPGGLLAFHVSNRYLDLVPVLTELARDARIAGAVGQDVSGLGTAASMYSSSTWVVLGRRASDVAPMTKVRGWRPLPPRAPVRLWTDDYTDVLGVVRWR